MGNKIIKFKNKAGARNRRGFYIENENRFKMVNAVVREIERKFPKLEIRDEFIRDFAECSKDVLAFEMDKKTWKTRLKIL